jgi:6-phosphogluconolactonase/glucosamine-6-phosphate isomerase/deaminase
VHVTSHPSSARSQIGDYIVNRINSFEPTPEKPYFVLGLPTGSSPLPVYRRIVELYQKGAVTFKVGMFSCLFVLVDRGLARSMTNRGRMS